MVSRVVVTETDIKRAKRLAEHANHILQHTTANTHSEKDRRKRVEAAGKALKSFAESAKPGDENIKALAELDRYSNLIERAYRLSA